MALLEDVFQMWRSACVVVFSWFSAGGLRNMENLLFEKRKRITIWAKLNVKFDVKLNRFLKWMHMHLTQIAWKNGMKHLVDLGMQLEKWKCCWWFMGLI